MTFGHASFDNWASEGVRTFRTIEAPELKEPNPEGEQCLEMFDEHKNKSLYPNMGGSDLFKPDKRLQFTGVGQCACECYADPDCVAFHIATAHADAQHIFLNHGRKLRLSMRHVTMILMETVTEMMTYQIVLNAHLTT